MEQENTPTQQAESSTNPVVSTPTQYKTSVVNIYLVMFIVLVAASIGVMIFCLVRY